MKFTPAKLVMMLVLVVSSIPLFAQIYNLKTEYLTNPLGVDSPNPRFTWKQKDTRTGAGQIAYQVVVGTDSIAVSKGIETYWKSGKVSSSENLIKYKGPQLQPFTRYFWKVEIWNHHGETIKSDVSAFETGLMNNWKGNWISDGTDINLKPAPYFRNTFNATKKIKSARAYMAAGGLFELYVNGKKIGDHMLDPSYTRFDRRILYLTHDITQQLTQGKNAIGVLLGNGWYNHQSTAVWYFDRAPWRNRPTFCLDIRITYEDGSVETIVSDNRWKTSLSPVVFNSIYTAEHYDARKEQTGWNLPDFDDKSWKNASNRAAPSTNIVSQALRPIRAAEEILPQKLTKLNDTTYVFDLGRNISGVSRFTVSGKEGTVIKLRHAERLYANGHTDLSNIDAHYRPTDDKDPFQTDIFILSGKSKESFQPRFNYKGFQFVEVISNAPLTLSKEDLKGYFIHSDVEPVGVVASSNTTLNKIWKATNNSYLSNLVGYPTDCPQREKNGWTGDAQIAIETGLYNFDGITVYEKWLADHRDEQQPNGVLPAIIPTSGWGYHWANGPDWTSTIAIIPWNLYLFYGDTKALEDNYDNIKRYVDHLDELYPTGLTTWGLGDWIPVKSVSPVELTSTAYYYTDALILAKTAKLFGKTTDYEKYSALATKIKEAFNTKYLNRATGIYNNGLQTELSVPLFWGLVPDKMKQKVADKLAERVQADGLHLDVGLLGTKAILQALSDNGYADMAYTLATQETFPSWGWWIVNGATTLYENWPIDAKSDISMNHIMFGEIGAWFYKALGGIKPNPDAVGFKDVILEPHFVNGLNQCKAEHNGRFGVIKSSWTKTDSNISYKISVPTNSTATVRLPKIEGKKWYLNGKLLNRSESKQVSGEYLFESK
ncbi:MAG: family 78 glycoside hydrolase catalytic domain [Spirosomataceae bacterium]